VRIRRLAVEAFSALRGAGCTSVVLACTDFTCILPHLAAAAGELTLVDPLDAAIELTLSRLDDLDGTERSAGPAMSDRSDRLCMTGSHPVDPQEYARTRFGLSLPAVEIVTMPQAEFLQERTKVNTLQYIPTTRIWRLQLPERAATQGRPLRELERQLEAAPAGSDFLDITYADTHRFPPPAWALSAFFEAASGGGMTYTPYRGDPGVLRDVATNISGLMGMPVDPAAEVMITPGTQAALYTAMAALIEPGDRVVVPDPDYLTSERSVRYFDGEVDSVPLIWEDGEPRLDLDVLSAALQRDPKLVMFSHPNNPTGAVFSAEHVGEIARLVRDSSAFVIVDELYCRLTYDGRQFAHLAAEPGMQGRVLTTLGPSKTESLSGYRVGAVVGPAEVIARMEDVMGIASLRCPAYAQHLLPHWIRDDGTYVAERITEYQALRDMTVDALQSFPGVSVEPSGGSAYLFVGTQGLDASDQAIAIALKTGAGLVVNPGYQFGDRAAGHFRICFAQDERAWKSALERMGEVLSGFSTR
jgi:aspartate/methionine/tyrosine aminotransferase